MMDCDGARTNELVGYLVLVDAMDLLVDGGPDAGFRGAVEVVQREWRLRLRKAALC